MPSKKGGAKKAGSASPAPTTSIKTVAIGAFLVVAAVTVYNQLCASQQNTATQELEDAARLAHS